MNKRRVIITAGLVIVFAALFVIGIFIGEPWAVWQKGANICLECIGIG